jgi:hypothetical protein
MSEESPHELGQEPPEGFSYQNTLGFFLRYDIDRNNAEVTFSYRLDPQPAKESFSRSGRDQREWSRFLRKDDLVRDLVIELDANTLIIMQTETIRPHQKFYWSRSRSAIKTRGRHPDLYFHLLYRQENNEWTRANDGKRTAIQFKAMKLDPPRRSHKFSCNVRFLDTDHYIEDFEIDPDIKNPSA